MRRWAFIVAVLGISVLLGMLLMEASPFVDLEILEENEKVVFSGLVLSEGQFDEFRILDISGFSVTCNCGKSFVGEEVRVEGLVGEFNGAKQIKALSIEIVK